MCQTATEVCTRVLFLLVFNWIMTDHSYSCILHESVQQLICDPEKLGLLISLVVNCIVSGVIHISAICKHGSTGWNNKGLYGDSLLRYVMVTMLQGIPLIRRSRSKLLMKSYISWFLSSLAFFEYKIFLLQSVLMKNVLNSTKKQFSLSHIKSKYRSVEFYLRKHSSLQVHWI